MGSRFGSGRGMSGGPKPSDFPCIHVSRVARVLLGRREKARTRQRAARADEPEPLRPSLPSRLLKSRRDAMGKPRATPWESYPAQPLALKGRDSMTHCALTGLRICWATEIPGAMPRAIQLGSVGAVAHPIAESRNLIPPVSAVLNTRHENEFQSS